MWIRKPKEEVVERSLGEATAALFSMFAALFLASETTLWDATVVCILCDTAKQDDGDSLCACGGDYVSLKELRWVPDEQPRDA